MDTSTTFKMCRQQTILLKNRILLTYAHAAFANLVALQFVSATGERIIPATLNKNSTSAEVDVCVALNHWLETSTESKDYKNFK